MINAEIEEKVLFFFECKNEQQAFAVAAQTYISSSPLFRQQNILQLNESLAELWLFPCVATHTIAF